MTETIAALSFDTMNQRFTIDLEAAVCLTLSRVGMDQAIKLSDALDPHGAVREGMSGGPCLSTLPECGEQHNDTAADKLVGQLFAAMREA